MWPDQRPRFISRPQHARELKSLSGLKSKPWYCGRATWRKVVSFRPESGVGPNHFQRPRNHVLIQASNPIASRGLPLVVKPRPDPEEKSANEQELVVETLAHSINKKHGGSVRGDRTVNPRYHDGQFFLQAYVDLSLHLTEGYTHSLTEGCTDGKALDIMVSSCS
jgi:hypothetical protein